MTRASLSLIFCVLSLAVSSLADARYHEATLAADQGAAVRSLRETSMSVTSSSSLRRLQQLQCDCTCGGNYVGSYDINSASECSISKCADKFSCGGGSSGTAVRAVVITLVVLIAIGVCIGVIICKVCGCCCFKKPTNAPVQGQQYIATGAPVFNSGPQYQAAPYAQPGVQPYDAGAYGAPPGAPPPGYPANAPPGVPPGKDTSVPQGNAVDGSFPPAPPPGYQMPYPGNEPMLQPGPYPPQQGPYPPQQGPYPPQPGAYPPQAGPYPPPQPEPYPLQAESYPAAQAMPQAEPYPVPQQGQPPAPQHAP